MIPHILLVRYATALRRRGFGITAGFGRGSHVYRVLVTIKGKEEDLEWGTLRLDRL